VLGNRAEKTQLVVQGHLLEERSLSIDISFHFARSAVMCSRLSTPSHCREHKPQCFATAIALLSCLCLTLEFEAHNIGAAELFYNYDSCNLFYYVADDKAIERSLAPLASNGVTTVMLSSNVGQAFICAPGVHLEMCHSNVPPSEPELTDFANVCFPVGAGHLASSPLKNLSFRSQRRR